MAQIRSIKETVDWGIVICFLALCVIGILNIYASSYTSEQAGIFDLSCKSGKQIAWMGLSLIAGCVILFALNPRIWEIFSPPLYAFTLILLVLVIFIGTKVNGSRSWLTLGPMRFQPAELSKIATSLMLATVMSRPSFKFGSTKGFVTCVLLAGLPMLAIVGEQETGTALVYCGFIIMMYREGLSGWYLFFIALSVALFIVTLRESPAAAYDVLVLIVTACFFISLARLKKNRDTDYKPLVILTLSLLVFGALVVASSDFLFNEVLQGYQKKRIEVLLNIADDPAGAGYNVRQSLIAIGSGGLIGKGFLHGTQTAYGFVPEQSTDFIFCTIGEEWGFIGCLVVIVLYITLILKIFRDAEECREAFTRIYGYCVGSCILMHLLINVGMTIGIMPVIGIPLPLVSYGGSSMLTFTVMISVFLACLRWERKYF